MPKITLDEAREAVRRLLKAQGINLNQVKAEDFENAAEKYRESQEGLRTMPQTKKP